MNPGSHTKINQIIANAFANWSKEKCNQVDFPASSFHRYTSGNIVVDIEIHQDDSIDIAVLNESADPVISDTHFCSWSHESIEFINSLARRLA
jgi:hypothetical protein